MNRIVATGFVALTLIAMDTPAAQSDRPPDDDTQVGDAASRHAVDRARETLATRLKAAPSDFEVVRVEQARWSDSSLGCRQPGSMYLQVISDGHAVVLKHAGQMHRVHVSGSIVVICDRAADGPKMPTRAQGLIDAGTRARNDLAQRLGLDPKDIRIAKTEPQRWNDASLGCPNAEKGEEGAISGYRLHLSASGRIYTYHTDLKKVLACPPIEES